MNTEHKPDYRRERTQSKKCALAQLKLPPNRQRGKWPCPLNHGSSCLCRCCVGGIIKLTPQEISEIRLSIVNYNGRAIKIQEIASQFGMSRGTIYRITRDLRNKRRQRR